jgi:hypothetical protein
MRNAESETKKPQFRQLRLLMNQGVFKNTTCRVFPKPQHALPANNVRRPHIVWQQRLEIWLGNENS